MGRPAGQTGTGRPVVPLSQDKKKSLFRCPFVPRQKSFACPAVPLSRDKGRCKNPGTNSSVPGRPRTKPGQKNLKKKSQIFFFFKNCNFFILFFLLSRGCPGIFRDGKGQAVKTRDKISKSCPGRFRRKILSLSHCPFVPGQWRDFCPFVPRDKKIPSRWKPYYVYMLVHIVNITILNSQQTNDNLFEHKNLKIRARTLMEFQSSKYSDVPNKRVTFYILSWEFFLPTCLLISEKVATYTVFYTMNFKKFPPICPY
jgi:hypothetical protein